MVIRKCAPLLAPLLALAGLLTVGGARPVLAYARPSIVSAEPSAPSVAAGDPGTGPGITPAAIASLGPATGGPAVQSASAPAEHPLGALLTPGLQRGLSPAARSLVSNAAALPANVDLSAWAPPVGDQGMIGSCTSWATGYYYRYWLRNHARGETGLFAPMYLYSQALVGFNGGSSIKANIDVLGSQGIARQSDYAQGSYDYADPPTADERAAARPFSITSYSLLFDGHSGVDTGARDAVEASMAAGAPVLLAIPVYNNFDAATRENPLIGEPSDGMTLRGIHAVFAPAYDAYGVWFENSWGPDWAKSGWAELSWAFVERYAGEAWSMAAYTDSPGSAPGRPLALAATPGPNSALVSWAAPTNPGANPVVGYTATSSPGSKTCSTDQTSCTVSGLVNGQAYTFTVTAGNANGTGAPSAPSVAAVPLSGATYVSVEPNRLVDSRIPLGATALASGAPKRMQVTERAVGYPERNVPAGAVAVTGDFIVIAPTSDGHLDLTPIPGLATGTSTINVPRGDIRANGVTVTMASDGSFGAVWQGAAGSTANVVFDVTGYFTTAAAGATYFPVTPARLADSRAGNGLSRLTSGAAQNLQVAGRGGVPADATAVTVNVTATNSPSGGNITLSPSGGLETSTLNFPARDTRANNETISLSGGKLNVLYRGQAGAKTDVIVDVTGYFAPGFAGATYTPMTPVRVVDSRAGARLGVGRTLASSSGATFAVAGLPVGAVAVTGNLVEVGATSSGYFVLAPAPPSGPPATSTINFPAGDIRANGATIGTGPGGSLTVVFVGAKGSRTSDVVFDLTGYFAR